MTQLEKAMTLDAFLELPEVKPAREFGDGKVVHKVSPKAKHGFLQIEFGARTRELARSKHLGVVFSEIRCTFDGRSLVFDVAYFEWDRVPFEASGEPEDDLFLPPDWAIEILSPGQTVTKLTKRLLWCTEHGVRLAWLVVPSQRKVFVFRAGGEQYACEGSDVLDAGFSYNSTTGDLRVVAAGPNGANVTIHRIPAGGGAPVPVANGRIVKGHFQSETHTPFGAGDKLVVKVNGKEYKFTPRK